MKFITYNNSKSVQNGYTLLFAVLTATLVLGVAVFILSVSKGQYLLASSARESVYAFYAADSGIECAAAVAKNIDFSAAPPADVPMLCNSKTYPLSEDISIWSETTVVGLVFPAKKLSVSVDLSSQGDSRCAIITFIKGTDNTPQHNSVTQIESRGYNYCTSGGGTFGPDPSNAKVVERAIRLTYTGM